MNTPNEFRPRLLCRMVRGWSALAGDPATGATARHLASCPACQEYFSAATVLESRLRSAAPAQARPLPVGFEQRLERALKNARPERESAGSGSRWVVGSLVGSLAAAAVVAFVLLRPTDVPPIDRGLHATNEAVVPSTTASSTTGQVILQSLAEDPLQREIDHVYSDARAALQFLALNFLPAGSSTETPSS